MQQNYLNMLSQKPIDTSMTAESEPAQPAVAAADVAPNHIMEEAINAIADYIASPEFKDLHSFEQFTSSVDMQELLTSPLDAVDYSPSEQPRLTSPMPVVPSLVPDSCGESPFEDFLSTPAQSYDIQREYDMLTGYLEDTEYNNGPLFNDPATVLLKQVEQEKPADVPTQPDFTLPDCGPLYTISPETPLDTFKSPSLYPSPRFPSSCSAFPSPAPSSSSLPSTSTTSRRRSIATGTRKGLTPESLVPIDAPTQPRKYISPSATSRKDLPAIFARKRSRSQAFEGDDELVGEEQLGPNATEKEQIEWKRRQNTLAARKSRKRKLLHQQELEESVERLTQEKEVWRTRALTLRQLLHSHGVPFNEFQD